MDERLVDWIKGQQSKGDTFEKIYDSLVQRGYTPDAANEAISLASQSTLPVSQSGAPAKKVWIVLSFILSGVVVVGLVSVVAFSILGSEDSRDANNIVLESSEESESFQNFNEEPIDVAQREFVKCDSIDCFIALAQSCKKGEVDNFDVQMGFFGDGLIWRGGTYFRIDGRDGDGLCVLVHEPRKGILIATEEGRQAVKLARGWTDEEVDADLRELMEIFNSDLSQSLRITCRGESADIATYLTNTISGGPGGYSCKVNLSTLESNDTYCTLEPNLTCIGQIIR